MSTITAAFVTFVAVVGLADWLGPGHDWAGLAALTGWFFLCRSLSPRGWRWLWVAAMVLSVAVAVLAGVQVALGWMPRSRGPFWSPNFLGSFAALMYFLSVRASQGMPGHGEARRGPVGQGLPGSGLVWWPRLAAGASLVSVALSQSRGALLALGAGLLVMAWGSRRMRLPASLAAIAAVAIIPLIRSETTNPRMEIWWLGWQAAKQRMLLGWGQGGVSIAGLDRFYSIPLDWLISAGILGVAAGAWLLIAAWRSGPELRPFLAAWFIQGLVLFGHPGTYIPLVAVLAYLSARPRPVARRVDPLPRGSHGVL